MKRYQRMFTKHFSNIRTKVTHLSYVQIFIDPPTNTVRDQFLNLFLNVRNSLVTTYARK